MGDSRSAGVVWLFFGMLAPILFLLKLTFASDARPEGAPLPWSRIALTAWVESELPLMSLSISQYLLLISASHVMPGALESRALRIGAFLVVLFFANFLVNYYVLFGNVGEDGDWFERERVPLSLLSGTLSTCLFPAVWLGLGSLLETYL
jgi:hypothetical protein